jgi:DNA topoisomerase VI subunit A
MTFVHEAAMQHNNRDDERPLKIFYIGDYDPAGLLIDRSLESELREHLNPEIEMHFKRIGITPEQISEYDLPSKPR